MTKHRKRKPNAPAAGPRSAKLLLVAAAFALAMIAIYHGQRLAPSRHSDAKPPGGRFPATESDAVVYGQYAGSENCKKCHDEEFKLWQHSHHGLAERKLNPRLDAAAFAVSTPISHGSVTSSVHRAGGQFQVTTPGSSGKHETFTMDRVIGHAPLRQFLVPAANGRMQVAELAFHPPTGEWFDVFGQEDRTAGEWGHWTGRGMTWNQMCASCHNTRLRKHYDPVTDRYATTMAELSVGCESCHGPMADHAKWQMQYPGMARHDPTIRKLNREQMLAACGACHARRGELTGEFEPSDSFFDHFHLTMTDETDLYYPDGQVRDENYEFTSFLSSRMFASGVSCWDCHEPHGAKVRMPDNLLCQRCHEAPVEPAPKIDALTHSRHKPGAGGDKCVDCHMPLTTYMQRHPRRDHGFTIPDPLLTKQYGIPNACNRCHTDKDTDWALAAVENWYGPRLDRPTRTRAITVAKARQGNPDALSELLRLSREETVPLWRATATRLLDQWAAHPQVKPGLLERANDPEPVVRSEAAHALSTLHLTGDPEAPAILESLLKDPARSVRIRAAWALRGSIDTNSPPGKELFASLMFNSDQPAGSAQVGVFFMDRGAPEIALPYWKKSIQWDPNSPALREGCAVCLSQLGRINEALDQLKAACRLAPNDAHFQYKLGLALNEVGKLPDAVAAMEKAVSLDAQRSDVWYNLGLGYAALEQLDRALQALARAETIDSGSARIPYARATVLARLGNYDQALSAAQRALELQPAYADAANLLQQLSHARR